METGYFGHHYWLQSAGSEWRKEQFLAGHSLLRALQELIKSQREAQRPSKDKWPCQCRVWGIINSILLTATITATTSPPASSPHIPSNNHPLMTLQPPPQLSVRGARFKGHTGRKSDPPHLTTSTLRGVAWRPPPPAPGAAQGMDPFHHQNLCCTSPESASGTKAQTAAQSPVYLIFC